MISVIIPHLNQPNELEDAYPVSTLRAFPATCLTSLWWTMVPGIAGGIVARHSGVLLQHEIEPGPGLARNTGVAASTGEILAFIDADCELIRTGCRTFYKQFGPPPGDNSWRRRSYLAFRRPNSRCHRSL